MRYPTGMEALDAINHELFMGFYWLETTLKKGDDDNAGAKQRTKDILKLLKEHRLMEEQLFEALNYPFAAEHTDSHETLQEELDKLSQEICAARCLKYVLPPFHQLRRTMESHIAKHGQQFAVFVSQNQQRFVAKNADQADKPDTPEREIVAQS